MKSVLISIQPKWCELIANGSKTIEVRKTKPKLETHFKVYIYCTYGQGLIENNDMCYPNMLLEQKVSKNAIWGNCCNGKVIGEFVCDRIYEIGYDYFYPVGYNVSMDEISRKELYEKSCLSFNQIDDYLNMKLGYGWHISNLVIYDKPRDLDYFRKPIDCHRGKYRENCIGCWDCEITRPPQSWCYVESKE